jgi:hypothetical protein
MTNYRIKTPTVISILTRKLKPNKTFEDFQEAHVPHGEVEKTDFGCNVSFFGVPTRVINAISCEDPSIIYSIGLSYGTIEDIFSEANKAMKEDSQPGRRGEKLDEICDDLTDPVVAFVASDNNYGGKDPLYEQTPLAQVTPEITDVIKKLKEKK